MELKIQFTKSFSCSVTWWLLYGSLANWHVLDGLCYIYLSVCIDISNVDFSSMTFHYFSGRKAKIYLTGQRTPRIILNGYIYGINRRYQNKTFWLCSFYTKTKCTARVTTSGTTAKLSNRHNHPPTENKKQLENATFTTVTVYEKKSDFENYSENVERCK